MKHSDENSGPPRSAERLGAQGIGQHDNADRPAPPPDDGPRRRALGTPRSRLISAMGLAYDPFNSGVSEQDLAPDFGAIYVDAQPGLLDELQRPQVSLLFADYGMGKTATRVALEYAIRLAGPPLTLSVTYTPNIAPDRSQADNPLQHHLAMIASEARIDLVVQYLERLPERIAANQLALSRTQQHALQRQARSLPQRFGSLLRAALADPGETGAFWQRARPLVRYVPITSAWRTLVELLVKAGSARAGPQASWEETVYDLRSLGFERMYVLVDAIDEGTFGAAAYAELIQPLLEAAADLARQQIYLKFFLPLELRELLALEDDRQKITLTPQVQIATIDTISSEDLDNVLIDRLQAAGRSTASFRSLDWFGQDLDQNIQAWLIAAAQGSPRRLIELASALLDFHSLHGFCHDERLWFTRAEWQQFVESIQHTFAPPS
jgi:hypothetical protein